MKKLSITELIEFRKKPDWAKKRFVESIKANKIKPVDEAGGHYWVTSLSAICKAYRQDDIEPVDEKINELQTKASGTTTNKSKHMYQHNVSVLQKYESMDWKPLRPSANPAFLKKSTGNPLLNIQGLDVKASPSHIFIFGKKGEERVGAIWFTAKINGYRIEEVGMFCDMLYRFLERNYSATHRLSPKYCIAVDMISGHAVNYAEIENAQGTQLLSATLGEITRLM